jgi:hypothetical protein
MYDSGPRAVLWINPAAYKYLPKLMEFISLNPLYLCLVMELSMYAGYVDILYLMLVTVNKCVIELPSLVDRFLRCPTCRLAG